VPKGLVAEDTDPLCLGGLSLFITFVILLKLLEEDMDAFPLTLLPYTEPFPLKPRSDRHDVENSPPNERTLELNREELGNDTGDEAPPFGIADPIAWKLNGVDVGRKTDAAMCNAVAGPTGANEAARCIEAEK
jgi:hypothetical protein